MALCHSSHVLTMLLLLLSSMAASTKLHHHHHHHHHDGKLKSLLFTLFQHETINKTGYIIVKGVTGVGITATTTPFGTFFVFQDPLTATPSRSSEVLGIVEGTTTTTSLDRLQSISVAKITLHLRNHSGSISIVGVTYNVKPADHPVVGGTGDFMFVQGVVRSSFVKPEGLSVVYKIQFYLYWPPHAAQAFFT